MKVVGHFTGPGDANKDDLCRLCPHPRSSFTYLTLLSAGKVHQIMHTIRYIIPAHFQHTFLSLFLSVNANKPNVFIPLRSSAAPLLSLSLFMPSDSLSSPFELIFTFDVVAINRCCGRRAHREPCSQAETRGICFSNGDLYHRRQQRVG